MSDTVTYSYFYGNYYNPVATLHIAQSFEEFALYNFLVNSVELCLYNVIVS